MLLLEHVHDGLDFRGLGTAFDAGSGDGAVAVDDGLNDVVNLSKPERRSANATGAGGKDSVRGNESSS